MELEDDLLAFNDCVKALELIPPENRVRVLATVQTWLRIPNPPTLPR